MAGTIVVDRIESDSSYTSTINVASKVNFAGGMQIGGSDALFTNRNMIHNGHMVVCQRNTSNTGLTTESYATTDRWSFGINTQGTFTMNNEPSGMTTGEFIQCSNVICTVANTSPPTGSYLFLAQGIEGMNLQKVKKGKVDAEWLTLSFWVKSNRTGTYVIELQDNNNRTISQAYTVIATNVWEKKILSFSPDTTGTFTSSVDRVLRPFFWLGSGSTYNGGTLNTSWNTNNQANRAAGVVNLAGAAGNYFAFTGVQLEVGKVATPFEYEDYSETILKCQRYFSRFNSLGGAYRGVGVGVAESASGVSCIVKYPVKMRSAPTASGVGLAIYDGSVIRAVTGFSTQYSGSDALNINLTVGGGGLTTNRVSNLITDSSGSGYFDISAEI
jgi:hypothetical protein